MRKRLNPENRTGLKRLRKLAFTSAGMAFTILTILPARGVEAVADLGVAGMSVGAAKGEIALLGWQQAAPTPPNPLLFLDIWVFGGLILLVSLVLAAKYLWKAIQPDRRDPAEGLQPWEDPDRIWDEEE